MLIRVNFCQKIIFFSIFIVEFSGVFFEMFTSGMGRRPPETYGDLKQRNYTLYFVEATGNVETFNLDRYLISDAER
jgi:hypothetical protein